MRYYGTSPRIRACGKSFLEVLWAAVPGAAGGHVGIHGQDENVSDEHVDSTAREGIFDAQLSFDTPQVAPPEPIAEIVKRDGRRVPFVQQKIATAIGKASELVDAGDADEAAGLAAGVSLYLSKSLNGDAVTAQQVQDAVERVLMEMGRGRVALAYAR